MAATTVEDLTGQIARVRENPGLPYEIGKDKSLDDLRQSMASARAALIAAIDAAPDSAFDEQPTAEDGEEVWSVGQIVGHCNDALLNIGGEALKLMEIELGEPPENLVAASEAKIMSREEAKSAAEVVAIGDFFAMLPDDDKLDNSTAHDFFGTMTGRSWLYFMAMHEAEHVAQIKALG